MRDGIGGTPSITRFSGPAAAAPVWANARLGTSAATASRRRSQIGIQGLSGVVGSTKLRRHQDGCEIPYGIPCIALARRAPPRIVAFRGSIWPEGRQEEEEE